MKDFLVREVSRGVELNEGHTDANSLGKLLMDSPDVFTPTLIYLWGQKSNYFPITTLTEGQMGGVKEVNSTLYHWPTMGKPRYGDEIASFNSTANPTPGIAGTDFTANFRTRLIIEQYGLIAPDGTKYRVMKAPQKNSDGTYAYTVKPKNPNVSCSLSNLAPGKFWVMTAPTIPEAYSRGNRHNKRGTGKMYNQIGFQRYTMEIGGNIAHKTVANIEFPTEGGGTTNLWVNEEFRQFEHNVLKYSEEHHWTSEFNRELDGSINMKDWDNGEDIPEGAGVFEMVKETNHITYGEILTMNTLNLAIDVVSDNDTDAGMVEVVLYGGRGFLEDFHNAIVNDSKANGFQQALGDKMISGEQGRLSYGNTFTQYRNIAGDTITVKHLDMLDNGVLADLDKRNGNIHPITGRPMCSHTGVLLDQSTYSGERNVAMAVQKGGADVYGIIKGISDIPAGWGSMVDSKAMSTEVDASKYERKLSKGINILNTSSCILIQAVA
jgi:hypothetical protein